MKKFIIILSAALVIGIFHTNTIDAQPVSVNVNINLDRQPAWGPVGYDYAEFYYFPALNIYFDVNNALFYYLNDRKWVANYYLPVSYSRLDLYHMYKVVLNNSHHPWTLNRTHKRAYAHFHNDRSQTPISQAKDHRYGKAKNNTRAWVEPRSSSHRSESRPSANHPDTRKQDKVKPADRRKESREKSTKAEKTKERSSTQSSRSKR